MSLEVKPVDATLGATITGVRIGAMSDADWRAVEDAFHTHALLILPGQHPSEEEQVAFGRRFGEIEVLYAGHDLISISNIRTDGTLMEPKEHRMEVMRGNEGWHTDSSYMALASKASCLSAHVVPKSGGQTEWADMRSAWDALDEVTRKRIEGLSARHSLRHSQAKIGHEGKTGASYGFHEDEPPLRPLVKRHPVTGRSALYIGRHAYGIPGLSEADSEKLLDDLLDFACQRPRTWQHEWLPGDVVIWDNRAVLHRARPYDHREPRLMKHVRIAGDPATEMALAS